MKTIDYNELTAESFRNEYFDKFQPLLIKNGLQDFDRVSQWNVEQIKEKYGSVVCNYSEHSRPASSRSQTTYLDFFTTKADKCYAFSRRDYIKGSSNLFMDDFPVPNKYFNDDVARHIFFAGPSLTGALPHKHGDAINFLVTGKKRWVIFDARTGSIGNSYQIRCYEQYPEGRHALEWFTGEYPRLKENGDIVLHECIQEDGDVVYIPNGFSHSTFNTTPVLGIVMEMLREGQEIFM